MTLDPQPPRRTSPLLVCAALAGLVMAVYGQVVGFDFVNVDDQQYVYRNPHVLRGLGRENVLWAFGGFHAANWHPLTWLSHMLDVQLFGLDAGGHHAVSLLLHALNTALVFALLRRATGATWRSAFAAALFGVHPLHAESVAWVSERKDVLSTLFGLLALLAHVGYARAPRRGKLLEIAGWLALGLMAKPMLVTLPFVLLLLDWWPLGRLEAGSSRPPVGSRIWVLVREKAALWLLSAGSCAVTWIAQSSGGARVAESAIPIGQRAGNALVSCATYLAVALWPARLAAFYPHPAVAGEGVPRWKVAGAAALLAAITWLAVRERTRRPYLLFGWLWYLGTLVPVIGLVQVGLQARADRYTYLPLVGVFVAAAWGGAELLGALRLGRRAMALLASALVLALSVSCGFQARHWRDSVSLLTHAIAVTRDNWQAWMGLGDAWSELGRYDAAVAASREALRIHPRLAPAWNGLGASYGRMGRHPEAVRCFQEAVRIDPGYADAWYNLGTAYGNQGQHEQALACFRQALRARPDDPRAWANLGIASLELGDRASAIEALRRLESLDRGMADALRRRVAP